MLHGGEYIRIRGREMWSMGVAGEEEEDSAVGGWVIESVWKFTCQYRRV